MGLRAKAPKEDARRVGGKKFFIKLANTQPAVYAQLIGKLILRDTIAEMKNSDALIQAIHEARDRAARG